MKNLTAEIISQVLSEPVAALTSQQPHVILASGEPITPAQQRRIQRLIDHGVPETIDAQAIDWEAGRRTNALVSTRSRELLQTQGIAACVAAIDALAAGDPLPQTYLDAKANLALVGQATGIETAAETIKAQDPLPVDYLALVAAFDAELAP